MNKDAKFFVLDNMLAMSAYWVCSGTVVAAMTSFYDLPLSISNLLAGVPSTFTLLQMLGGLYYSRISNKNMFLRIINLSWRILLPLVFFSVLLPINIGAAVFVVAIPAMVALFQISCPAQTAWMVGAVEGKVKASYYAFREMMFMLGYSVLFCIVGLVIDSSQRGNWQKNGFLIVGIIELIAIAFSIPCLLKCPNAVSIVPNEPKAKKPLLETLCPVWQNKAFMKVLYTNVVWSFANMFIGSFSSVYQVRTLNMPFSVILVCLTIANLSRCLATPFMQRLAVRYTWRRIVQAMMLIMISCGVGWLFVTPENMLYFYPILAILSAIPFAGLGVGFLQLQVDSIPKTHDRTVYFSFIASLNGVGALIGSFVCSLLITALESSIFGTTDLRFVFAVGVAAIAISVLLAQKIQVKNKLRDSLQNARV